MINYKNFKKSISSNIDIKKKSETLDKDNNINYIAKSNTIHIIGSKLINGDNQNNINNISYHIDLLLLLYHIFSKYTNSSEMKKELSKNCNYIQKITISKINLQESNNVSSLNKNNNNGNLSKRLQKPNQKKNRRYLTDCSKRESRPIAHISTNNHNNNGDNCEEDLDDNEFMGMRKKTFDPGKGAGKII